MDFEVDLNTLERDPGPPAWTRSWRTINRWRDARDLKSWRAYVDRLRAEDCEPVYGITPSHRPGRDLPVPWDMLVEEFAAQSVFLPAGTTWLRLRASAQLADGPAVLRKPLAFASLTLDSQGGRHASPLQSVGALDARARWTDRMAAGEPEPVRAFAAQTGQPLYLVWVPGAGHGVLELRDTATDKAVWRRSAKVTRAVRGCPLIPGSPPGQLCRMYGGPWVSAAIVAAGKWRRQREWRLRDVGCDTCGDGVVRLGPFYSDREIALAAPLERGDDDVAAYGPIPTRYAEVVPHTTG